MDYHLIVKIENRQYRYSSFSKNIYPEIDDYVKRLFISKLTYLEISTEDITKMASKIQNLLDTFFNNEYTHKEFDLFRPKSIQEVTYAKKKYYIHITDIQYHRIELLDFLNDTIKNNGIIVLYGDNYLEFKQMQILNCINEEGLKNKKDIIARIDSIRHPDFNVDEALKELEKKDFLIMNQELVLLKEKAKWNNWEMSKITNRVDG